jgi:IMP cyclohydrolase
MSTVAELLSGRPYPGRGCVAARTGTGELVFAYFLTGRSEASRNREMVALETGDVVVRDAGGESGDPLRHYVAAARRGPWTVVGNGHQVVALAETLAAGRTELEAWSEHTFEPDEPIFTSRIWAAHRSGGPDCLLGFARRSDRPDGGPDRVVWLVDVLAAGSGTVMTTYAGTADKIARTTAPVDVTVAAGGAPELLDEVWRALTPELRVAAVVLLPEHPEVPPAFAAGGRTRST